MSFVSASLTTAPLQQQTLTPQQQYALKLLHMNASELLAEAERAAEENPLIECEELERSSADTQPTAGALHEETEAVRHEGESIAPEDHGPLENTYTSWTGSGAGDPDETPVIERVAAQRTLREDLLEELGSLPDDPKIHPLVGCLIEELDDSGFLTTPLAEVAKSYMSIAAAPAADWQKALALLPTFGLQPKVTKRFCRMHLRFYRRSTRIQPPNMPPKPCNTSLPTFRCDIEAIVGKPCSIHKHSQQFVYLQWLRGSLSTNLHLLAITSPKHAD